MEVNKVDEEREEYECTVDENEETEVSEVGRCARQVMYTNS